MPSCPYRSWSVPNCNNSPNRPDTIKEKEMDDKLKKMIADRNSLDQRINSFSVATPTKTTTK